MATTLSTLRDTRKRGAVIVAVLAMFVAFGLGAIVGQRAATLYEPSHRCPTEDSCIVDYHGGRWHITPDIP